MAELVVMGVSCGKNKENMCLWTGFWVKIVMQHYIGSDKSLKENLKGKKSESFPIFKDQWIMIIVQSHRRRVQL